MSAFIVVVHSDRQILRATETLLTEQEHIVVALSSFLEARELLESVTPDLLIADLHLGRYNGLHLAIRTREDHPDVPVIITFSHEDPIAEAEAVQWGAAFIVSPLENETFLPRVQAAVAHNEGVQRPIRRWSRSSTESVVEVGAAHARAKVVDVSYGGIRLAFQGARQIPTTFDIALPSGDVTVTARRVWTSSSAADDQVWCGAELTEAAAGAWREFVDSVQHHPPQ